jgi:hypothetical protein
MIKKKAAKVKGLGKVQKEEAEHILDDFRETLPDFCASVLFNGVQKGNEWVCSDLQNSPCETEGEGSCNINLTKGVFHDHNPAADPKKGGMLQIWMTIFECTKGDAIKGIKQWNENRTLPDGSKGVVSGKRVELSGGVIIEATDKFEQERVKAIGVFQDWIDDAVEHGPPRGANVFFGDTCANDIDAEEYIAKTKARNNNHIAWVVSDILTRRWLQAVEFTQEPTIREEFASELTEMRGLSREVFLWLIDTGNLACVYERGETPQAAMMTDEGVWEEPPPIVQEFFNIAFPVCRDVTPDMEVPPWAGRRYFTPDSRIAFSPFPEEVGLPLPTIQFFGMQIPWTDKDGHKHWRYNPKGCPAHPYIIGDVGTADLVVLTESTWDGIAYIDLRKLWTWKKHKWAVIITRGASNAHHIPADKIKDGAVVLRLLQNDAGNAAWVASLPSIPQAEHREIKPPDEDKDLNDWMKRAGKQQLLETLPK